MAAAFAGTSVACGLAAPGYRGNDSRYFDGHAFANQVPTPTKDLSDVLRWKMTSEAGPWEVRTATTPARPPPARVGRGELRVTWINHATVLIQMDGLNILTDPIWSERASPFSFVGPKRMHPPGVPFAQLPAIDVVLVSHNHYDHLDISTLARLARDHRPIILAGLGTRALLKQEGIGRGHDMDWWETRRIGRAVSVTAVPAQHWSRRGFGDTNNTLWAGFVIVGTQGPVYFAGDTGWGPHFEQIRARFGPIRLALLPIGAYKPRWFMRSMHISPAEAVDAARILEAQFTVPIHWGTFALGDDGQDEPIQALEDNLNVVNDPPTFLRLDFGEGRTLGGTGPGG